MSRSFVIFVDQAQWRVGILDSSTPAIHDLPVSADATPQSLAQAVAKVLESHQYDGCGVILAIPSAWVLCALIDVSGLPRKSARQAMLYRLEEQFPVAAEDVVADFIVAGSEAFGVAAQVQVLKPIVDALEACNVRVEMICPASLLALQHDLLQGKAFSADAVLRRNGGGLELFTFGAGKLRGWKLLSEDPQELSLNLSVHVLGRQAPLKILVDELPPAMHEELHRMADLEPVDHPYPPVEVAATLAAGEADRDKLTAWVNLRRDILGASDPYRMIRRPLTAAMAAGVLLCVCLCAAMFWRAHQYDRLADDCQRQQQEIFRKVFPQRTPVSDVAGALTLREQRLRALAGESSEAPPRASALTNLYQLLSRLPAEVRFRVMTLRLSDEGLLLEGEARAHADADSLAAALRAKDGFTIESPQTELTPQGVRFTITGSPPARPGPIASVEGSR